MAVSLAGLTPEQLQERLNQLPTHVRPAARQLLHIRKQEALSREALDDPLLPREQREVHRRRLEELHKQSHLPERAIQALEAGWTPFTPSPEWFGGFVEDPRFLRGKSPGAALAISLAVAAAAALLSARGMGLEPLSILVAGVVVSLGLWSVIRQALGALAEHRERWLLDLPLGQHQPRATSELPIFNAPMPTGAAKAYRTARQSGLFDVFVVCSPRAEDFRQVSTSTVPTLGLLDPILAGFIGRQGFEIARWDLAEDLGLHS